MKIIDKQLKADEKCWIKSFNDIGHLEGEVYYPPAYGTSFYLAKSIDTIEKAQELFIEFKEKNIPTHNKECEALCRKIAEEEE